MSQPMNLYFPSAWLEQAERELDYSYQEEDGSKYVGYFLGIQAMDQHAYAWIVGLWFVHRYNYSQPPVPVWVYTHQRNPNRLDRRVW